MNNKIIRKLYKREKKYCIEKMFKKHKCRIKKRKGICEFDEKLFLELFGELFPHIGCQKPGDGPVGYIGGDHTHQGGPHIPT